MIPAADVRDLVDRIDLLELVGQDTHLRRESARSWAGPCVWCGGDDRLYVKPEDAPPHWRCRHGCGSGDAIAYVMKRDGLTFPDAFQALGGALTSNPLPRPRRVPASVPSHKPSKEWRAAAGPATQRYAAALWAPDASAALEWLRARGLRDDTLRAWRIGYSRDEVVDGLRVPGPSVVIPWFVGAELWALKVRLLTPRPDGTRYMSVTWADAARRAQDAAGAPFMYGAHTLPGQRVVVVTEGELDALLLHQEAGDLSAVVTLGGCGKRLDGRAAWLLLEASDILVAYDVDEPGEKGAAALLHDLPAARRVLPPALPPGKDITDAFLDGADLRAWVGSLTMPRPVNNEAEVILRVEAFRTQLVQGQTASAVRLVDAPHVPGRCARCGSQPLSALYAGRCDLCAEALWLAVGAVTRGAA